MNDLSFSVYPQSARSLLDVGCGSGAFGRSLRQLRPEMELWAVEPDPASARAAESAFDHVLVGNFPNSGIPGAQFDVVLCADVLEHMADQKRHSSRPPLHCAETG